MNEQESKDVLHTLKNLLKKLEEDNSLNVLSYEMEALKNVIEQYGDREHPMSAYFSLENWLNQEVNKDKPVEIKSAMIWGALWVIKQMNCIDWDEMRSMYGEFMSHKMNVR